MHHMRKDLAVADKAARVRRKGRKMGWVQIWSHSASMPSRASRVSSAVGWVATSRSMMNCASSAVRRKTARSSRSLGACGKAGFQIAAAREPTPGPRCPPTRAAVQAAQRDEKAIDRAWEEADAPGTETCPVNRARQPLKPRTGVAADDAIRLSASLQRVGEPNFQRAASVRSWLSGTSRFQHAEQPGDEEHVPRRVWIVLVPGKR